MFLLDINVLIALVDPNHEHHDLVVYWFTGSRHQGWATCPIVENGFIRIIGHPNYPDGPKSTNAARTLLNNLCEQPGHQFWPDSVTVRNNSATKTLPISKHLTDHYLLLLAIKNRSQFATLDKRIDPDTLLGGASALYVIR
jgi:toxin-antitoxin system PIN domain toxin